MTGKNDNNKELKINGLLKNFSEKSMLKFYYTDETHHFSRGDDVKVSRHSFSQSIPANCVFTFVSN
jgi:hypothetical protein